MSSSVHSYSSSFVHSFISSSLHESINALNELNFVWSDIPRSADVTSDISLLLSESNNPAEKDKMIQKIWDQYYKELKTYKAKNGHLRVPFSFNNSGFLPQWMYNQRIRYARKSLPNKLIKRLKRIGFNWDLNETNKKTLEFEWVENYEWLADFFKVQGHCRHDNNQVHDWESEQRCQYEQIMNGDKAEMTELKINLLNKIGLDWNDGDNECKDIFQSYESDKVDLELDKWV